MGQDSVTGSERGVELIELRDWGLVDLRDLLQFIATRGPIVKIVVIQDVAEDNRRPHERQLAIALCSESISKRAVLTRLVAQTGRTFRLRRPFRDAIEMEYES